MAYTLEVPEIHLKNGKERGGHGHFAQFGQKPLELVGYLVRKLGKSKSTNALG